MTVRSSTAAAAVLYGLPQLTSLRLGRSSSLLVRADIEAGAASHHRTSLQCCLRHFDCGDGSPINAEALELLAEICAPTLRSLRVPINDDSIPAIVNSKGLRLHPFRKLRRIDLRRITAAVDTGSYCDGGLFDTLMGL
jgi:hypothetical protein